MRNLLLPLFVISLFLFLPGCSLDYSDSFMADEIEEDIPDTILAEFVHVAVRSDVEAFRIEADRGENYDTKKESRFFGVSFQELDRDGEILTRGSCDRAVLYLDSDNIDLWGNLSFYSSKEAATILAEHLFWNDAEGRLLGDRDGWVVIEKDSGTYLEGVGFLAEVRKNRVEFQSRVNGAWVDENE